MKELYKYVLRAITKARWDTLNEEYLVYKQSLVDKVTCTETEMHHPDQGMPDHERSEPKPKPRCRPHSNRCLLKRSKTKTEAGKDMEARIRP
jgi:hypothetical protein